MKNLKYIGALLGFFAIIVGAGYSIGSAFAHKEVVAGICAVVLSAAAFPTARKLLEFLKK